MFRLLLLLIIVGAGAYFTNPTEAAHDSAAQAAIEGRVRGESRSESLLQEAVGLVKGMLAGEGRYQNYYVLSKYAVDLPGSSYVDCTGAFTLVRCIIVEPGDGEGT